MATTKDIADKLAKDHDLPQANSKALVESVFAAIVEAATRSEEVSIPGFGKFKTKQSPEREGRNPATGAALKIAASTKINFLPAKALKDALNK